MPLQAYHQARQASQIFYDSAGRLHVAGTVRIEEIGDVVEYDLVRIEVVSVERHAVRECMVTPIPEPGDEPRQQ